MGYDGIVNPFHKFKPFSLVFDYIINVCLNWFYHHYSPDLQKGACSYHKFRVAGVKYLKKYSLYKIKKTLVVDHCIRPKLFVKRKLQTIFQNFITTTFDVDCSTEMIVLLLLIILFVFARNILFILKILKS